MDKIRINKRLIPIVPKKYRYKKGFISCEDILCDGYYIDCEECPIAFDEICDNDIHIIGTNERLIEVRLCEGLWSVTDKTLKDAKEKGIHCRDVQCICMKEDIDCEYCKFNWDRTYSLKEIIWREIN